MPCLPCMIPPLPGSIAHGMLPIDRHRLLSRAPWHDTVVPLLHNADVILMHAEATAALDQLRVDPATLGRRPVNTVLQVYAVHLAATLTADALEPVGTSLCFVCGGAPVASTLVDRPSAARNLGCCVCTSFKIQWNGPQGDAQTSGACNSYPKIVDRTEYPVLHPAADDVAGREVDIMLRDVGWRRGGVNSFPASC